MTRIVMSKEYVPNHDIRRAFEEFVTTFSAIKDRIINRGSDPDQQEEIDSDSYESLDIEIEISHDKKISVTEEAVKLALNNNTQENKARQEDLSELREAFAKLDRLRGN